jgi:CBS domain-containing protein
MSLHDQKDFLSSIHPFELLNESEMDRCIKAIDIAYYPKGTVLISSQNIPEHFFIIIKGEVQEFQEDEIVMEYHSYDCFDADSLIYSKTTQRFVVSEDLICYELAKKGFLSLIESNEGFKNFFLNDLSHKLQILKQKEYSSELSSFMVARVNESYLHTPCIVSSKTPLFQAIKRSMSQKSASIIVEKEGEYGIITDSDLKKDVLLKGRDLSISAGSIAKFPLITVESEDFLFDALLVLTKHTIKRVGVLKNGKLVGVLEQIDLLSYFANQSHLAAVRIKKADTIEELKKACNDFIKIVKTLHAKGVKVNYIAKLIAELNAKVYEKLFFMILPPELSKKSSLIVMGSEGRREQIIKTDQDNALIIENGVKKEQFFPYMQKFSKILIDFGYPRCKGNIMVSNPYWCKTKDEYIAQMDDWLENPDMDSYMYLAIFFDAQTVAGDEDFLKRVKKDLFERIQDKDVYLAYFAKLTLLFETPIGMFSNLITEKNKIDLKKGGIFPIVQGVRSLCLMHKIEAVTTVKRIKELHKNGILEKELASELLEAYDALGNIRLKEQLKKINNGQVADNLINPDDLGKLQRDLLKDSFKIVNRFKKFIIHHFKLDLLP